MNKKKNNKENYTVYVFYDPSLYPDANKDDPNEPSCYEHTAKACAEIYRKTGVKKVELGPLDISAITLLGSANPPLIVHYIGPKPPMASIAGFLEFHQPQGRVCFGGKNQAPYVPGFEMEMRDGAQVQIPKGPPTLDLTSLVCDRVGKGAGVLFIDMSWSPPRPKNSFSMMKVDGKKKGGNSKNQTKKAKYVGLMPWFELEQFRIVGGGTEIDRAGDGVNGRTAFSLAFEQASMAPRSDVSAWLVAFDVALACRHLNI